ncbi:hypothetical protein DL771_002702 [Monosporascus sp. 5C6A]|nr:hypothetical protein DL771_002702 [Monosporascus sp. 5C6A]
MSQIAPLRYATPCSRCGLMNNQCDQKLPGCNGCEKAGVACVGYDCLTGQDIPRCYTIFLEARARQLEYLFYKNGTKYLSTEDVLQLFKAASYQYNSNCNTLAFNIPGDIQVKEDPEQEPCAAALSCGEKGVLSERSSKGDASNTDRTKASTGSISNDLLEKQAGVSPDHQGKPVAHAGVQTNMPDTTPSQSSRVTQDNQASVRNLEQWQVLPMLPDQQYEKRLQYQAEHAQQPSQSTSRPNGWGCPVLQGYQMQLMLLEQQNEKGLRLQRQAKEAQQGSEGTSGPENAGCGALEDYQMQLRQLEELNNKGLRLEREAEEAQQRSEGTNNPKQTGSYTLELNQAQPTIPGAQNQNRLGVAHQEQEQTTTTNNHAIPDTRPYASPSRSVESLTMTSGVGVSDISSKSGATEAADIEPGPEVRSQSMLCHFKPQIRQVGRAKVRLEILSLSDDLQKSHEATDHSDDDPDESDDSLEAHDDIRDLDTTDETHTTVPSQNRSENVPPRSGTGSETLRDGRMKRRQEEEEEEGDDNDSRKRKRQKASGSEEMAETARLACPYQAYEKFRPCFKRSGSNPRGGCADLKRLNRNHMPSHRCQNCWAYLNTKDKAADHENQTSCSKKPRPQEEIFMTEAQENAIKGVCQSQTDEDAWWRLFRLLIPGMRDLDMAILTANYTPYYHEVGIHVDFSMLSYHQTQSIQPTANTPVANEAELQTQNVLNPHQITRQETFAFPRPMSTLQDAPVLEFMGGPIQDPDSGFFSLHPSAGISQLGSNIDSRRSSNRFEVPLSSASTTTSTLLTSDATAFNRDRMQQNYRRLRTLFQHTVEANQRTAEAHQRAVEANQRLTMGIDRIYLLVDDILVSGEIPSFAYDKLVEVAEIISRMKDAVP